MRMRTILVTLVALLGLGVAGCGGGGVGSALDVVASTNVYGDLAAQIGGSHVHVTSVLTNPDADPHLFEPGTQNGLAVAQARVVIQNGAEPPAEAVAAMNALIQDRRVDVLLYNSQAVSPITARVRSAAQQAGIPVVGVTETLPAHLTFQQWQLGQVRELERALAR